LKQNNWGRAIQNLRNQRGSAVIEFIGVGLILLVPLLYISIVVATIQSAGIATQNAARAAARVFVESDNVSQAIQSAKYQAQHALANFGMGDYEYDIEYLCETDPCFYSESAIEITVKVKVPLPLAPPILGLEKITTAEVIGSAVYQVPRF